MEQVKLEEAEDTAHLTLKTCAFAVGVVCIMTICVSAIVIPAAYFLA